MNFAVVGILLIVPLSVRGQENIVLTIPTIITTITIIENTMDVRIPFSWHKV